MRNAVGGIILLAAFIVAMPALTEERRLPASREEITLSYASVVEKAAPAVVTVYARRRVVRRTRTPFSRFFPSMPDFFGVPRERIERALGSGVILDPHGFIITNEHVVRGSTELTVALNDKTEFDAELVLSDAASDLAVLKIEPGERALPYLKIRDSGPMHPGDLVLAIGNPFGIGQTVTSGIISAPPRSRAGINDVGFFLQTDAAINQGNSGGALVAMNGELAGVNTAIFTQGGGSIGVGFAIPASMVRLVLQSAREGHPVIRRWIGADFQTLSPRNAANLNLNRATGVLVRELWPDGPAQRAGLQQGDVIYSYGGQETDDVAALNYHIATASPGLPVELLYYRGAEARSTQLLAEPPPENPIRDEVIPKDDHALAGLRAGNLSPALAQELGINLMTRGVVLIAVNRPSRAYRIGLRPGDILRAVNGRTITDAASFREVLKSNGSWRIQLQRGERTITLVVR